MKETLKQEILENMSVFSAILDVLSVDMDHLFQMTGYRSQNAQRLDSLIKESKRGLTNLKQLIEKENEMEFDQKTEKKAKDRKPAAEEKTTAPEMKESAATAAPKQAPAPEPEADDFGINLSIPANIREEMHKVLIALNNVAHYAEDTAKFAQDTAKFAQDQITVTNRVFTKYIAGLYNIDPKVIIQALEQESLILQKMHEREDRISDAETLGEKNDGNTK